MKNIKGNWACTIHQGTGTTSDTTLKDKCEKCEAEKKAKVNDIKEKTEAIRLKCIETDPSILDLVFECQIKYKGKISRVIHSDGVKFLVRELEVKNHNSSQVWWLFRPPFKSDGVHFEIIGREIRLADILFTIGSNREFFIGSSGCFYKGWADWDKPNKNKWNLRENSLSWHAEHSPETILAIYDILGL